jgi:hypothetical protein
LKHHLALACLAATVSTLTVTTVAHAAFPEGNQSIRSDPKNDARALDRSAKNVEKAKEFAEGGAVTVGVTEGVAVRFGEAHRYTLRNADGDGATFGASFKLGRLAGAKTDLAQFVILTYSNGTRSGVAGHIIVHVNSGTATMGPATEDADFCVVDTAKNKTKSIVSFTADPACLGVGSAMFTVDTLIEHNQGRRTGGDIATDAMKDSDLINLSN